MTDHWTFTLSLAVMLISLTSCVSSDTVVLEDKELHGATFVEIDLPPLRVRQGGFRRELHIKFLPDNESEFYQRTHREVIEGLFGRQYLDNGFLLDNISTIAHNSWRSQWEQLSQKASEGEGLYQVEDTLVLYVYPEYISTNLIVFLEEKLLSGNDCSVRSKMFWSRPNDLYSIEQLMKEWGKTEKLQHLLYAEIEENGIPVSEYLTKSIEDTTLQNSFIGEDGLYLTDWKCGEDFVRPERRDIVIAKEKLRSLFRADYLK